MGHDRPPASHYDKISTVNNQRELRDQMAEFGREDPLISNSRFANTYSRKYERMDELDKPKNYPVKAYEKITQKLYPTDDASAFWK